MTSSSSLPLLFLLIAALAHPQTATAFVVKGKAPPVAATSPLFRSNSALNSNAHKAEIPFFLSDEQSTTTTTTTTARAREQSSSSPKKTLYEILGASPKDSRSQIKKRYLAMAKQCHPDALLQFSKVAASSKKSITIHATNADNFHQVAKAWGILGDAKLRRKYDRELTAKSISNGISASAGMCFKIVEGAVKFLFRRIISVTAERKRQTV